MSKLLGPARYFPGLFVQPHPPPVDVLPARYAPLLFPGLHGLAPVRSARRHGL